MQYLKSGAKFWIAAAMIITLFSSTFISRPNAQTQNDGKRSAIFPDHDEKGNGASKKGWTLEKRAKEAWLWHMLNRRRLDRTHPLGADAITNDAINTDIDDISVIQGDPTLVTPANPFDLNSSSVLFTPSGAGYTIASSTGGFDTNVGTKLNLTVAPAVNPKPGVDPGDDAYIIQDLGFNFSLYGTSFSSVAVSSNGFLAFRPGGVDQPDFDEGAVASGESLSDLQSGLPRIAPYWHDLDARAAQTGGTNGIFIRRESDRVLITWNNIRDFPNDPVTDRGAHTFQVSLFSDGRIQFIYATAQLTTTAIAGVSPGNSTSLPVLVDLKVPPSNIITAPIAELFSISTVVDTVGAVQAFYATHPNQDVYDFVYLITDFDFSLGDAFAFYLTLRNDATGIGLGTGQSQLADLISSQRIQGILNLSNIRTDYPDLPTTRIPFVTGSNHALSVMAQEQGHRWMTFTRFPGPDPRLLLGRDDAHWSFFMNIESTISTEAARRSSSMEGSVWRDNGNGSFTSLNMVDGYSRLDHYLMGLRPAGDVTETFVIANPSNTGGRDRGFGPEPNITINGTRQSVTINQIIQANSARNPDSTIAQKNFRAAVVLLVRQGSQPGDALLNKIKRYRLAWESYFSQSTDFLATVNTGLADQTISRVAAAASAASFKPTLAAAEIAALFGVGLTSGATESAATQPLPTTLAGAQVFIDGAPAPLFFASPQQINFQVPRTTSTTTPLFGVSSATALIEVFSDGQLVRAGAFQIAPVVPAVFTINQSGTGPAAAVDAINSTAAPFDAKQANGQPNIIAVFGTGLGADATDIDGNVNASVQVTIDGNPTTVSYAGRAPGFAGLNQLNVIFPENIASGTRTLVVTRNGVASRAVTIAVR